MIKVSHTTIILGTYKIHIVTQLLYTYMLFETFNVPIWLYYYNTVIFLNAIFSSKIINSTIGTIIIVK